MSSTPRRIAITLLAAVALACAGDSLAPSASTLDGAWSRLDEIPGSSERWNLTVDGSSIAGDGSWTGEACCAGPLTISGTVSHDSIHVNVTLTDAGGRVGPFVRHFDGALVTRTLLQGKSSDGNGSVVERFGKQ